MKIFIIPMGTVDNMVMAELSKTLAMIFGCVVEVDKNIKIPTDAYNKSRNQYQSSIFLSSLKKQGFTEPNKVLGITTVDLYAPGLDFIFGQAEPDSYVAIISLSRLDDEDKFLERANKEAVHELGHTFGLIHCSDINCVMHFSNSLHDTDIKKINFCSLCQPKLIR
jgi:archaemetzincin